MDSQIFCQSCSMPLSNDQLLGTEKDGSKNHEYCKYCYQDGAFVNPDMTLQEMTQLVKEKMKEMNIDAAITEKAVNILHYLRRWDRTVVTNSALKSI